MGAVMLIGTIVAHFGDFFLGNIFGIFLFKIFKLFFFKSNILLRFVFKICQKM